MNSQYKTLPLSIRECWVTRVQQTRHRGFLLFDYCAIIPLYLNSVRFHVVIYAVIGSSSLFSRSTRNLIREQE
uniref:Uncharacterized protein n=1 Tax=Anguilla anguilla TaxID=7936 RepID=A0A0E9X6Y2_ANGAN